MASNPGLAAPSGVDPAVLQLLGQALAASPAPVVLFDPQDRVHWCNDAFREVFGFGADEHPCWDELMRRSHAQGHGARIQTDDFEHWLASARSRRGKLRHRAFESDLHDGRWLWVTETVSPEGWMFSVLTDISGLRHDLRALRQARDVAERAALTDVLTGLSNRAHALGLLAQALHDTDDRRPLCIALLDLDHFKQVNDRLGHAAGDEVIRDFARCLQAATRRSDTCARIGGEEFLLILPGTDPVGAGRLLERLLERVRRSRPLPDRPDWGYTCSGGLALARPGDDPKELIARADQWLYQAKQTGRDRIAGQPAVG